jgi:quercetin dioxygenase-like cupin family protein
MRAMIFILIFFSGLSSAHESSSGGVQRDILISEHLPNLLSGKLTAVEVDISPLVRIGSHQHEGFVYVYVLEGYVHSQLGDQEIVEYKEGDSWIEQPGITHSLTHNPSKTSNAKLLAVFLANEGARLTTSGVIEEK